MRSAKAHVSLPIRFSERILATYVISKHFRSMLIVAVQAELSLT